MSERERKVGSVTYQEVGDEYFQKRGLRRHAAFWSLWSLVLPRSSRVTSMVGTWVLMPGASAVF